MCNNNRKQCVFNRITGSKLVHAQLSLLCDERCFTGNLKPINIGTL